MTGAVTSTSLTMIVEATLAPIAKASNLFRTRRAPEEVFVEGRGDMGRTDVLNYTDLLLSHELQPGGTQRVRLELNVLNVFNQKTVRRGSIT